jgi:hypothetical protein
VYLAQVGDLCHKTWTRKMSWPVRATSLALAAVLGTAAVAEDAGFTPLFPADGPPKGWVVREWNDLARPAAGAPSGRWPAAC